MVSSFNRLPLEVLTNILAYAPDLPTIYKFITASSKANAAFNIDSPNILDAAIERSIPEFRHPARMIAILGTLASSPDLIFKGLVDRYNDLPGDILSTAPASYAFVKGTPGPRYLVLTAYRIEMLRYICFVSLFQNIHEVIWPITPDDKEETIHYPIKQSRAGIQFQAAVWWAPSWVEKMRIVRAYWNLFVYWNIQAISPDLTTITDDWKFSIYRTALTSINPGIGPCHDKKQDSKIYGFYVPHEIEEMKCVLVATPRQCQSSRLQFEKWASSTTFKESSHWILEQPESAETPGTSYLYQDKACINEMNFHLRTLHWRYWYRDYSDQAGDQLLPPDYLGLCIWDHKRLGYLALKSMPENLFDPCWGPVRNPTNNLYTSTRIHSRWRNVFLQVLLKLPGGKWRPQSKNLDDLKIKWYRASSSIRTSR